MVETLNGLKRYDVIGDLARFDDWMTRNGNPDFHRAVLEELTLEPRLNSRPYPEIELFRSKTVRSLTHGGRCFAIGFVIDDEHSVVRIVYARSYSNVDRALKDLTSASLRGVAERFVEAVVFSPFL